MRISMRNSKGQFLKGITPWNKSTKGVMTANTGSFKKGDNSIPLEERFWSKVKKTPGCWSWLGSKDSNGYGRIMIRERGGSKLAHRIAYEIVNGEIPSQMHACHKCDNPSCVNPDHIFIGTAKDNLQDMSKKGRWGNQFYKNI